MQDEAKPISALEVAEQLAKGLNERNCDYALGGAIALGYWGEARGTMDVDLTLFLPPDKPSEVTWMLAEIGCEFVASEAVAKLQEHGFCPVMYDSIRVDVFVPMIPFYEQARLRRKKVNLGQHCFAMVWDAETLSIFKMMFFRRKDIADVEQILRLQRDRLDRNWIREQLVEIYGPRDARIAQWDELISEQT
jgi:hypothetical protein